MDALGYLVAVTLLILVVIIANWRVRDVRADRMRWAAAIIGTIGAVLFWAGGRI